jgi:hypothetical protein
MAAPTVTDVQDYLGAETEYTSDEIGAALASEKAAQARKCRVPADDAVWPEDLVEALCRRVQRNLAVRALPLGLQTSITDAAVQTTRIGRDPEVGRLEAPWRKVMFG